MTLLGKGFFAFNLPECEDGDPGSIRAAAQAAGLSHIIVKIADGTLANGIDASGVDFTAPVVQALQQAGMAVWGWQYIYGDNPSTEATLAITRTQELGLEGLVVSAGEEYEQPGRSSAAHIYMTTVRAGLTVPIALSSFRFPNYHPNFPWSAFLLSCDLHMPQVFWELAHNAGEQLIESKRQCDALPNAKPFIPTGAAYPASDWSPTAQDIIDFLNTAEVLCLPAVNFFDWETCRASLPLSWKAIAGFIWPCPIQGTSPAQSKNSLSSTHLIAPLDPFLSRFLSAFNSRDAAQASAFYDPSAVQVWADKILRGVVPIQAGFTTFFNSLPAGSVINCPTAQVTDDLYTFAWKVGTLTGETILTMQNGKIILDYTFIY
jgi:hypothetical protein